MTEIAGNENMAASVGQEALKKIYQSLEEAQPESDIERREQMSPDLTNLERLQQENRGCTSADHSDLDVEVPPPGAGKPCHGGTSQVFPTELLEKGYDTDLDWVVKHYIPANAFGVIYGPSESFKSFHAVSLAASIATGKVWNGVQCQQSAVLYIAAEGGVGASKRAQGWKMVYNNREPLNQLHAIKMPVFLGSPKCVNEVINTIVGINESGGEKVAIVFIDTLARCFGGADENKTADMNLFVAGCDKIRVETGVTVVVVHHTGKNREKDARGSSALRAACDFEYLVDRPDKQMFYTLKCTKLKDSEPPKAQAFDMTSHFLRHDTDGDEVTTLVPSLNGRELPDSHSENKVVLSKNQEALWQAARSRMATGEPTTVAVIRDDLKSQGLSMNNFGKWKSALIAKGLLKLEGDNLIPVPPSS